MGHLAARGAYGNLVTRLNKSSQGAPPSELLDGILKILFTEREASLVASLPIRPFKIETAARASQPGADLLPFVGPTSLYILPGFEFRVVDVLITNFHLPRSTLLMLVCAFAGREEILAAYGEAVKERYRFYSYGDAMLITSGMPLIA